MKKIRLNKEEYNVLSNIARKTKMDCWFKIHQKRDGSDVIKDIENGKYLSLRSGISQLYEGLVPELIDLSSEEWDTFYTLLEKLNIKEV